MPPAESCHEQYCSLPTAYHVGSRQLHGVASLLSN